MTSGKCGLGHMKFFGLSCVALILFDKAEFNLENYDSQRTLKILTVGGLRGD